MYVCVYFNVTNGSFTRVKLYKHELLKFYSVYQDES